MGSVLVLCQVAESISGEADTFIDRDIFLDILTVGLELPNLAVESKSMGRNPLLLDETIIVIVNLL